MSPPGFPLHVTQRGNRRQPAFFQYVDYRLYLDLLAEECRRRDSFFFPPYRPLLVGKPGDPACQLRAFAVDGNPADLRHGRTSVD